MSPKPLPLNTFRYHVFREHHYEEEHDSFRDLADRMIEEKDKEISKLLDDNKNLHRSLESRPTVEHNNNYDAATQKQDAQNLSPSAAEQQILILARQQAQREKELAVTKARFSTSRG